VGGTEKKRGLAFAKESWDREGKNAGELRGAAGGKQCSIRVTPAEHGGEREGEKNWETGKDGSG